MYSLLQKTTQVSFGRGFKARLHSEEKVLEEQQPREYPSNILGRVLGPGCLLVEPRALLMPDAFKLILWGVSHSGWATP